MGVDPEMELILLVGVGVGVRLHLVDSAPLVQWSIGYYGYRYFSSKLNAYDRCSFQVRLCWLCFKTIGVGTGGGGGRGDSCPSTVDGGGTFPPQL